MNIETFNYNDPEELKSNTYIISDDNRNALVFDPSVDYNGIIDYLENHQLNLKGICLTHGHFDHFRGVKRLLEYKSVPVYIHSLDALILSDIHGNCSDDYNGHPITLDVPVVNVNDNEILKILDGDEIRVIHTPYHTAGSVCYYLKNSNILISGDSLFKHTVGRWDLPTSVPGSIKSSLSKLIALPGETKVYPGHGNSTSISNEEELKDFLKGI